MSFISYIPINMVLYVLNELTILYLWVVESLFTFFEELFSIGPMCSCLLFRFSLSGIIISPHMLLFLKCSFQQGWCLQLLCWIIMDIHLILLDAVICLPKLAQCFVLTPAKYERAIVPLQLDQYKSQGSNPESHIHAVFLSVWADTSLWLHLCICDAWSFTQ